MTNERDPDSTYVESDVEIEVEGLAEGFRIVESLQEVEVTVKGPRSVVQNIGADDIVASVDLGDIDAPGIYERNVGIDRPAGLRYVDVDPDAVEVRVDSVVSETFEITVVEPEDPPALLTSISLSTSTVTLTGVQQNVEDVERVELTIQLSGRTESFTYAAEPVPIGPNGPIDTDTVSVEPQSVQVSVEFEVGSRSIPVIVQCACPTEDGEIEIRDLSTATAIPPTVRVEGPQPLLEDIEAVRTVPINIEDVEVSEFLTGAIDLDLSTLPEGVTVDTPSVGVYVQVQPSSEELIEQEIAVINPPSNRLVDISPASISFELRGSAEALAMLSDNPPVVVIDLEGLGEGTYTLSPRVLLPPDVEVVSLVPEAVQVIIERPPPPTPTPSPTPGPDESTSTSSVPARRSTATPATVNDTIN